MKVRDISNHDPQNAEALKAYDGVIIKATEGTNWTDGCLDANVAAAKASGKPWGLYHYLSFRSDINDQIHDFRTQLDAHSGSSLRVCLDIEQDSNINQTVPADLKDRIDAFCLAFSGTILYANRSFIQTHLDVFRGHDVWQAEYDVSAPTAIDGINRIGWQYRENPDESTFTDAVKLPEIAPAQPSPVGNGSRPAPAFPLPSGSYFGPKDGPAESVSGYYSHRDDLRTWQSRMAARGWAIDADGLYGDQTAKVARQFQAEKGLSADGLIGPATWAAAWTAPITK